jgi:hypothetical protein
LLGSVRHLDRGPVVRDHRVDERAVERHLLRGWTVRVRRIITAAAGCDERDCGD